MVIYGEEYGNVIAIEAQTGVEKWRFKTKKTCRTPSIAGEILYARCDDHNLYALDPQTGALKWSFDSGASGGVPTIANGVMYVLTSNGTLQALR